MIQYDPYELNDFKFYTINNFIFIPLNSTCTLFKLLMFFFKISNRRGGVVEECLPRMREIGVRSLVGPDLLSL